MVGDTLELKHAHLRNLLAELGSVVVAFSAGVDSTLLVKVASDVLGERVLAVTGLSDSYPTEEAAEARRLANQIGVATVEIQTDEMEVDEYRHNAPDRCFHCKSELFGKLASLARERGYDFVVDGANADDRGDYRPGSQAARQLGVRSPLQEVGLTKEEIRVLSKSMGLPTWDKPAMACLASRIPYGDLITGEKLLRIDQAERYVRGLGISQVRVRCHQDVARIELLPSDLTVVIGEDVRSGLVRRFRELGFAYVTLDLQGYRLGSMNEQLGSMNAQLGTNDGYGEVDGRQSPPTTA